ncbi:MAG: HAMP domain-containing sensor histidine kinase [Myxococcota bacterium]
MNRQTQFLLGISTTVGATLLLVWFAVQALILRPAIEDREPIRIQQVQRAADLLRAGVSKREVEVSQDIDVRLLKGQPEGPPPGDGWIRQETERGVIWKRQGGDFEIAAWTGHTWVMLQSHPPHTTTLVLALIAAGVPVIVLMFGLSQRANRHQERAEAILARIAAGDLSERLDTEAGHREARRVAVAVNQMVVRLQALIASDRQRMAGLSHELRTPLTRIRLELELARREGASVERLDRVEQDIEEFDAMLREMLDLSRLEMVGRQLMRREIVDLAGLAQLVVEEERWTDVEIQGSGTATVDRLLVARLIRNLLRNSAQHAQAKRRWITVTDDMLAVGDDGPGIPLEQQPRITTAFHRGAASSGHGLGLAIVAQIAELHGGTVTFSSPPGLVVTVRFAKADT